MEDLEWRVEVREDGKWILDTLHRFWLFANQRKQDCEIQGRTTRVVPQPYLKDPQCQISPSPPS